MAETIVEGGVKVTADTTQLKRGMQDATGSLTEFEKAVGNLNTVVAGAYAFMGLQVLQFGAQSIQAGADFQQRHAGFVNLVKGDTDKFLNELRRATQGTVKDIELMTGANKALLLGISQEQLPMLFEAAEKLGSVVGVDAADAFNRLTMGIETGNEKMLKSVGIVIDLEGAYAKLGKTADQLTDSQKEMIRTNLILEQAGIATKMLTTDLDAQADKVAQATAKWDSFKNKLNEIALGGFESIFDIATGQAAPESAMGKLASMFPNSLIGRTFGQEQQPNFQQNIPASFEFGGQAGASASFETSNMGQFNRARAMLEEREALLKNNQVTEESLTRLNELTEGLKAFSNVIILAAKNAEDAERSLNDMNSAIGSTHGATLNRQTGIILTAGGTMRQIGPDKQVRNMTDKEIKALSTARSSAS